MAITQIPEIMDIEAWRGDDWKFDFIFQDSNNVVINISTWTITAQIRTTADADTIVASFTCAITDGPAGEARISLTASATAALPVGVDLVWDMQKNVPGDGIITVMRGSVTVGGDVTR